MKQMTKHPIVFIIISLILGGLLQNYQSQLDVSMFYVLGSLLEKVIELLRNLSLHSWYGNVFAWILFVFACWIPMMVAMYVNRNNVKSKYFLLVSLMFSVVNMALFYGVLNNWFMSELFFIAPELFMQFIYFVIGLIIVVFVFAIWFVYVLQDLQSTPRLIQNFQFVMLINMIVIAILTGYNATQALSTVVSQSNHSLIQWLDVFSAVPHILIIGLLLIVISVLEMMKIDLLNVSIMSLLKHVKVISIAIVITSLFIPLVSGLLQLFLINQIENINIGLSIPFTELIVALIMLLISEVLRTSIAAKEENKQFI